MCEKFVIIKLCTLVMSIAPTGLLKIYTKKVCYSDISYTTDLTYLTNFRTIAIISTYLKCKHIFNCAINVIIKRIARKKTTPFWELKKRNLSLTLLFHSIKKIQIAIEILSLTEMTKTQENTRLLQEDPMYLILYVPNV